MYLTSVHWQDNGGLQRRTVLYAESTPFDTIAEIRNVSNAGVVNTYTGEIVSPSYDPLTTDQYDCVGYMLTVQQNSFISEKGYIFIPAPTIDVLAANQVTLDPLTTRYGALLVAELNHGLIQADGSRVSDVSAGWVTRESRAIRNQYGAVAGFDGSIYRGMVWADVHGHTVYTFCYQFDLSDDIMDAMQAISNAKIVQWWTGDVDFTSSSAVSALFPSILDGARISYTDAIGNIGSILIPAPVTDMFYADGETVDLNSSVLNTLLADVLAELVVPSSGLAIDHFLGGRRMRTLSSPAR